MTDPLLPLSEDRIATYQARWEQSASIEEKTLLRLAILRDLMRELHAEKSRYLASGNREQAQTLRDWEKQASELKNAASLDGELLELLQGDPASIRKRTRLLPEALFSIVDKEKFERYDRAWESVIAAEAAHQGWRFWTVDAWVRISEAEVWHKALGTQILPHGIVLFAETAPSSETDTHYSELWHGLWTIVMKPRFLTPDFRLKQLPGISLEPEPPQWKLLFSATKR